MFYNVRNKALVILMMIFLASLNSFGGNEKSLIRIESNDIVPFQAFSVEDNKYSYMESNSSWSTAFTNYKVKNHVLLGFDQNYTATAVPDCEVTVELLVKYFVYEGGSFVEHTVTPNPVLTIDYSAVEKHNDVSLYTYDGGLKVNVTIASVTSSIGTVPLNLYLETQIEAERYYNLDLNSQATVTSSIDINTSELVLNWPFIEGAEEYDVEWTYVNDYNEDGTANNNPPIPGSTDNLFKYNSSRITTRHNEFNIPNLYERGFLLYRVRSVGRSGIDFKNRIFSKWSSNNYSDVASFPDKYQFAGHETNINWQMEVLYAEEGKNKAIVSYLDGSKRNRQSVTRINTEKSVIVGETVYDYQGRGAVQILPTPTNDQKIKYYPNHNKNLSDEPFSKNDFDLDSETEACSAPSQEISSIHGNGSGVYYSPNNNTGGHNRDFIPNAKGYPYTQVEYTPDNTGRVRRKSGVGIDHKLDSGHEKKMYYGKPEQYELDRLFGSEAGYANHYKKNLTVNTNGQVSLTFVDLQGKTVATTLIGDVPLNLEQLDNNYSEDLDVDLLNKVFPTDNTGSENEYRPQEGANVYNRELLVATEGPREFEYEMIGTQYLACDSGDANICYNCVFDLQINLTDECGEENLLLPDGSVLDTTIGTEAIDCIAESATYHTIVPWNSEILYVGNYSLSKILSVNNDVLESYTQHYLNPENNHCIFSFEDFLDIAMGEIDTSGCDMTCSECVESMGGENYVGSGFDDVNSATYLTENEWNAAMENCSELCDTGSVECQSKYTTLLIDVSPMGQYGGMMVSDTDSDYPTLDVYSTESTSTLADTYIDPSVYPLSVYNEDNLLAMKNIYYEYEIRPNWRFPFNPGYPDGDDRRFQYINDLNEASYVVLLENSGVYYPTVHPDHFTEVITDADGTIKILPQYLESVEDFMYYWQTSWAEALVHYHPEYPYYEFCTNNEDSHDWDWYWSSMRIWEDDGANFGAASLFFGDDVALNGDGQMSITRPNPLGTNPLESIDPYFYHDGLNPEINPFFSQEEYDAMQDKLIHYQFVETGTPDDVYFSIWQVANILANCPDADCMTPAEYELCKADETINTVEEWTYFKSLYVSLKQQYYTEKLTAYAISEAGYNGCISDETFDPFDNGFYDAQFEILAENDDAYNYFLDEGLIPEIPTSSLPWPDNALPEFQSQYYNYEQPCNWVRAHLYIDKVIRFPRIDDVHDTPEVDENIDEYADEQANIASIEIYESCNQCPIARDFQMFLNGVVTRASLIGSFQLDCSTGIPEYVTSLESQVPGTGGTQWTGEAIGEELTVSLDRTGGSCEIVMAGGVNFVDLNIVSICCLQATGYEFVFTATLDDGSQIDIEGETCFVLSDCEFDAQCSLSQAGSDVQNLLNTLNHAAEAVNDLPAVNSVLFSTTAITLNTTPYESALSTELVQESGLSTNLNTWTWTANTSAGTQMVGTISDGSSQCTITLTKEGVSVYNWTEIVNFFNIRVNSEEYSASGSLNHFKISALINVGGVLSYVPLTGEVSCFTVGDCVEVDVLGSN